MSPIASDQDRIDALEDVGVLAGLPVGDLQTLERKCHWKSVQSGNLIIGQHDSSDDVLFLVSGHARVNLYSVNGKQVSFRDVLPGAIFGELSAIDEKPRSADVEAIKDSQILVMPHAVFVGALDIYPSFRQAILLHLTTMVRTLTERVFEFSTMAVRSRVRAELVRLAGDADSGGPAIVLSPTPTHFEIANRISTHREAVTREFSHLEELGVIRRDGRTLIISDLDRLTGLVEDIDTY